MTGRALLGDHAAEAARDAVVGVVDRRAEVYQPENAGEGDERNQQRVLDQVLAVLIVEERGNGIHHDFQTFCVREKANTRSRSRSGTCGRYA